MSATMNPTSDAARPQTTQQGAPDDYTHRLSDGQANSIYAAAYHLSQQGKHDHASTLFALLSMYCPNESKYARSVAICFRKMGRYEDAIRYFARTMELRPQNYEPAFQLIECMLLIGRQKEAIDLLEKMAAMAADTGQEKVLERSSAMLTLMSVRESGVDAASPEVTQ